MATKTKATKRKPPAKVYSVGQVVDLLNILNCVSQGSDGGVQVNDLAFFIDEHGTGEDWADALFALTPIARRIREAE